MKKLTAHDFDQELLILFDAYVHGVIDRRGFLAGAQKFAVAGMSAGALLAALSPNFAQAQQVNPGDARLKTERLTYPSPDGHGAVNGYLARPANVSGPLPAILVVHENRGLNDAVVEGKGAATGGAVGFQEFKLHGGSVFENYSCVAILTRGP